MTVRERGNCPLGDLAARADPDQLLQNSAEGRKSLARASLKAVRDGLSEVECAAASERIAHEIFSCEAYQRAETIFSYLSFGTEVETRCIIRQAWADGKLVALPRCAGPRILRWYQVSSFEGLEKSRYGMWEPPAEPDSEVAPGMSASTLAIVPGLAFDASGMRLGYGGGYYDAFLASYLGVAVGVCFSCQLIPSLSAYGLTEPHDQPVSRVISS